MDAISTHTQTVPTARIVRGGARRQAQKRVRRKRRGRAFEEARDLSAQVRDQLSWALGPVDEAARLASELTTLPIRLGIERSQFRVLAGLAFDDSKIDDRLIEDVDERVRDELQAVLVRLRAVGVELESVRQRAVLARRRVMQLALDAPRIGARAEAELLKQLASADRTARLEIEADLRLLDELPVQVKNEAMGARFRVGGLQHEAKRATTRLVAAFSGDPAGRLLADLYEECSVL